jgi:tetratricopeptide (TPR) repeat protein
MQGAVRLLDEAIRVAPGQAAPHCNRGLALQELQQWDAALASYNRAIALKADYALAYFNRGNVLKVLGQRDAALASYTQATALSAGLYQAHYQRGILLQELERWDEALASFDQAVRIKADYAEAYAKRANVLAGLRRWEAALADYERLVAIEPHNATAQCNRAVSLQELERWEAALAGYDRAIAIKADYPEAHFNRGVLLQKLRRWDAALAGYDRAIGARPDYAEAHLNRGAVLSRLGQFESAVASFNLAIAAKADLAEAYSNRANAQRELQQWDAALDSCNDALARKPDYAEAYLNRANVHAELEQWETALADCEQAIALAPHHATAHSNRGAVLLELNRLDEAGASHDRAIALDPEHAVAHVNRAMLSLLRGDYASGWRDYEWRWKQEDTSSIAVAKVDSKPQWTGEESLAGKTILLHYEQGLGDTLQFCRYVDLVSKLGARVMLSVQPPLAELLAQLTGASQLVAQGVAALDFDYHCPLMSLPLAFKTALDTVPAMGKYLYGDPARIAKFQAKLGERHRPRVGLVWSGISAHKNDRNRSIRLTELIQHLPVEFEYISLQKELRPGDRETLESKPHIRHFADELRDFSDTAALGECLDLVISVDTSVAHLSAALGKRTWIVLPFRPDWRWLLERTDSPWYSAAKLYRQHRRGAWSEVLKQVKADMLQEFPAG